MANKYAPLGYVYVCFACGKTSPDRYGTSSRTNYGWDESCMLNAVLCYSEPDPEGLWVPAPEGVKGEDR